MHPIEYPSLLSDIIFMTNFNFSIHFSFNPKFSKDQNWGQRDIIGIIGGRIGRVSALQNVDLASNFNI